MTLQERFNLIPPCLRDADGGATRQFDDCVLGSLSYYIELLLILVAITAFFYIIYAGIQMATAFGNESKYTAAKATLLHAIIGIVIASLSYTVVSFVTSFFGIDNPKNYTDTGQTIENDPAKITAAAAIRASANPGNGELTEDELEFAETGTNGGSLTASGNNVALYLLNDAAFTVYLVNKSGQEVPVPTRELADGRHWARLWGPASELKGTTLKIYQIDPETGYRHKKEVKIN